MHPDFPRRPLRSWVVAAALVLSGWAASGAGAGGRLRADDQITVSDSQALAAGRRVWQNECGGTLAGLTSWNAGEGFPSLGLMHAIWYPRGQRGPFEESFPALVAYLAAHGVGLPDWLREVRGGDCPWPSREAFARDLGGPRLTELRRLLARPEVVGWQARFCADRLAAALPRMLASLEPAGREPIRRRFFRVARSPGGIYALVDYVNFKGEGVAPTERYQGEGWGLLQVLARLPEEDPARGPGSAATQDFAAAAAQVLARRVAHAPPERGEARWLPGWTSRVWTYAAAARAGG